MTSNSFHVPGTDLYLTRYLLGYKIYFHPEGGPREFRGRIMLNTRDPNKQFSHIYGMKTTRYSNPQELFDTLNKKYII